MSALTETATVKILIVDDHAFVRQGLRDFIERESDLTVCGEAAGRIEALRLCSELEPDLVLADLSLGEDSGLDLLKDIVTRFPSTRTLVVSMQDEMLYADRVLRAGASGFIGKDAHPDRFIEAVRCVLAGEVYASEAVKQRIIKSVRTAEPDGDPISRLSDRELDVFERIGKGQGTADIASGMNLSVKTVETYRARIKTKLGVNSSSELVQQAVQWLLEKQ